MVERLDQLAVVRLALVALGPARPDVLLAVSSACYRGPSRGVALLEPPSRLADAGCPRQPRAATGYAL